MPPKSKKPRFFSRFVSFFDRRGSKSTVDCHQDSHGIAGPSGSDHRSTRSVPDLSLPVHNSTSQSHRSHPPIRQSRSENNVVESSQCAALSIPGDRDLLPRPPHQLYPTLPPDDNPAVPRVHGGTTTFLAGASGFRMGDMHYYEGCHLSVNAEGGAGDRSIDGMSVPPLTWTLLNYASIPRSRSSRLGASVKEHRAECSSRFKGPI